MSGYQFFHVETYARTPSKTGKKQSIIGLVREAERHPSACLHIDTPETPTLLFGEWPSAVANNLLQLAEQAKDSRGRKLRKDAQILLAGVASYPIPSAKVNRDCPRLQQWLKLNLEFLKNEYGSSLKSCLLHLEESRPHIHFYCHPNLSNEDTLNIRDIHCGMKLRDSVPDKGIGSGKLRSRLYKQAMRDQQDRYYSQVGIKCGLTRIGPKTRKLSRKEWVYEQENAKRQQVLLESEQRNEQMLSALKQTKAKNLDLLCKNNKLLKLIEEENTQKSLLKRGFFGAGKNKLNYLKTKLDQSLSREAKLKTNLSSEKRKVNALEGNNSTISRELSQQKHKVEKLENKVSKLIEKIDTLTKAIKVWKQKYYQLIGSANLINSSKPDKNNNYESSYDV